MKIEALIKLIDQENSLPVLVQEDMWENFQVLLKYKLVSTEDEKVIWTSKGRAARTAGINNVLYDLKLQEELQDFSVEAQKREFRAYKLCLGLCITLLALFIVVGLENLLENEESNNPASKTEELLWPWS